MGFQAGVCVDLDQAQLQVIVQHEIEAQPLEPIVVRSNFTYQLGACRFEDVTNSILNLGQYSCHEADVLLFDQELVKIRIAHFVASFIFAIVLRLLLHSVIRQVDEGIVASTQAEFFATRTDIAFFIKPPSQGALLPLKASHIGEESEDTDVKLPSVDQEGIFDISLYDASLILLCPAVQLLYDTILDFLELVKHADAMAPVGVFTWLDDPPATLLVDLQKVLELLMLQDVFLVAAVSSQVHDIGLRHDIPRALHTLGVCVLFHVSMQLALCCNLVYPIDVVVDLVRQQILDYFHPSHLGEDQVGPDG